MRQLIFILVLILIPVDAYAQCVFTLGGTVRVTGRRTKLRAKNFTIKLSCRRIGPPGLGFIRAGLYCKGGKMRHTLSGRTRTCHIRKVRFHRSLQTDFADLEYMTHDDNRSKVPDDSLY